MRVALLRYAAYYPQVTWFFNSTPNLEPFFPRKKKYRLKDELCYYAVIRTIMHAERATKRRKVSTPNLEISAANRVPLNDHGVPSSEGEDEYRDDQAAWESEESLGEENGASTPSTNNRSVSQTHLRRNRLYSNGDSVVPGSAAAIQKSIFHSQARDTIDRLVVLSNPKQAEAEKFLHALKKAVESLPARPPRQTRDAEKELLRKSGVRIPGADLWNVHKGIHDLEYAQPASINVAGSYALKTSVCQDGKYTIDMIVSMPHSMFTEKDYLNTRYSYKRAYFLACLAAGISATKALEVRQTYGLLDATPYLPVLLVDGANEMHVLSQAGCTVRIIPTLAESGPESEMFSPQKLLPVRNCLRPIQNEQGEHLATPAYNGAIRANMTVSSYLRLMNDAATTCSGYRDACILGRIWLRQRGLEGADNCSGFGNFEFSAMMALLLQGGGPSDRPVLSTIYDAQQLFKTTIGILSHRNLINQPITIGGSQDGVRVPGARHPVFWDNERSHNVLYKMTNASYQTLRSYAQAATKSFGHGDEASFEQTFIMKECEPLLRSDLVIKIDFAATTNDGPDISHMRAILQQGLTDRTQNLDVQSFRHSRFATNSKEPDANPLTVLVWLSLDGKTSARTVDRGPPAEEKDAASKFATLWGSKAELRRFRDGSIQHSVVWTSTDPIAITKDIVTHLLTSHRFVNSSSSIHYLSADLTPLSFVVASGQNTTLLTALSQLQKDLAALPSLPLTINSVYPASPIYSSTSLTYPPKPSTPISLVLTFERSTRWPSHLTAIQATKSAFLLHLSAAITQHHPHLRRHIGLENAPSTHQNTTFLDVSYSESSAPSARPLYTFRLRIHHDKEPALLRSALSNLQTSLSERLALSRALLNYRLTFLASPLHTSSIASFGTRFPAYPDAARLLKTWFAAHRLSGHIREETIDLLAARPFVEHAPWRNGPGTPANAFLRCVSMLARWQWTSEPWLVDLSHGTAGSDTVEEREESRRARDACRTRFLAWRSVDVNYERMAWYVAASNLGRNPLDDGAAHDRSEDLWTAGAKPGRVIAGRVGAVAGACAKVIRKEGAELKIERLFRQSVAEYDFVLRINKRFHAGRRTDVVYKNLVIAAEDASGDGGRAADGVDREADVVPAFVEEVNTVHGEGTLLLFYDETKMDVVCGMWNPEALQERKWKVGIEYPVLSVGERGGRESVTLHREAVLAEIARLGGDVIDKVELKSS